MENYKNEIKLNKIKYSRNNSSSQFGINALTQSLLLIPFPNNQ